MKTFGQERRLEGAEAGGVSLVSTQSIYQL